MSRTASTGRRTSGEPPARGTSGRANVRSADSTDANVDALALAIGRAVLGDTRLASVVQAALARPTLQAIAPASPVAVIGTDTLLRLREVLRRTGLKRSTLYSKIAAGSFPRQVALSRNCVGWYELQVNAWIGNPN